MQRFSAPYVSLLGLVAGLLACGSSATSGESTGGSTSSSNSTSSTAPGGGGANGAGGSTSTGGAGGSGPCGEDPVAPTQVLTATSDPDHDMFTMTQALDGLPPGPGPLRALIDTSKGLLTCTLQPDKAPIGTANFVGLARGRRAFLDPATQKWTLRRFYDGLIFHRVIPEFVAQGGDPLGTGYGGPGYEFGNETSDLKMVAGALAYANAGPGTNGSQYFVTETAQPSLDTGYTIFGLCSPIAVVTKLTHVPVDANDKPITPEPMKTIKITRCAP